MWRLPCADKGAQGVDGQDFAEIEASPLRLPTRNQTFGAERETDPLEQPQQIERTDDLGGL